ncbi:MAG: hypothetical protein ACJ71Z_06460, partial [Aeromicrobium sp.]
REDYPAMNPDWRKKLLVCTLQSAEGQSGEGSDGDVTIVEQDQIPMRSDLLDLFEVDELKKYLTSAELPGAELPGAEPPGGAN